MTTLTMSMLIPPVMVDEATVKAALRILKPKPEQLERCRQTIAMAIELIDFRDTVRVFQPQSRPVKDAMAEMIAALQKARTAKAKLPWSEQRFFDAECDLDAGIKFCQRFVDVGKQTAPLKVGRSGHRQRLAVKAAYDLVNIWALPHQAKSISKQSAWYKLSDILFGKRDEKGKRVEVDLRVHMRRYKKNHLA
jgi:hypothetical protein